MSGLFGTLDTAKRTINTQQAAINTTTHNQANVGAEGYTRQRVDMTAARAMDIYTINGYMQYGTGVDIKDISRIRDVFLDIQLRDEYANYGKYSARDEFMSEIETITLEPSSKTDKVSSLSELMGDMWDSWSKLVNNPQILNSKSGVEESCLSVTNEINHIYKQMDKINGDCKTQAGKKVDELNSVLREISDLNEQISTTEISGGLPNDLLDKRDLLIDNLSKMMDIRVIQEDYGRISITTSSYATDDISSKSAVKILDGTTNKTAHLNLHYDEANNEICWYKDEDNSGSYSPSEEVTDSRGKLTNKGGSIAGYISVDAAISEYQGRLNAIAKTIATAVNTIHNTYKYVDPSTHKTEYRVYGPTDGNKYVPIFVNSGTNDATDITAANITVNKSIQSDPSGIRQGMQLGALSGEPITDVSDTSRAFAMSQLKDMKLDLDGVYANPADDPSTYIICDPDNFGKLININGKTDGTTIDGFYQSYVLKMGSFANESKNMTNGEQQLLNQLLSRKDGVSGVNRDEETTNLVEFQHALNAAFKVISVVDELLQSVINLIR